MIDNSNRAINAVSWRPIENGIRSQEARPSSDFLAGNMDNTGLNYSLSLHNTSHVDTVQDVQRYAFRSNSWGPPLTKFNGSPSSTNYRNRLVYSTAADAKASNWHCRRKAVIRDCWWRHSRSFHTKRFPMNTGMFATPMTKQSHTGRCQLDCPPENGRKIFQQCYTYKSLFDIRKQVFHATANKSQCRHLLASMTGELLCSQKDARQ